MKISQLKSRLVATFGVLTLIGCTGAVEPEQTGANLAAKEGAPGEAADAIALAHLAAEVASYGRQANNARAMLVAAELLASVGGNEEARERTEEPVDGDGGSDETGEKDGDPEVDTVGTLLADARAFAGDDAALIESIERVESQEGRGRRSGPAYHVDRVSARSNHTYSLTFAGGNRAMIAVIGDGDTDLDLLVYDENQNLVCSDTDYTDRTVCSFTPAWTGNFRVTISNVGYVWNQYVLRTN